MIAWWILPLIFTLLVPFFFWKSSRARDMYEGALWLGCTLIGFFFTLFLWIVCGLIALIS